MTERLSVSVSGGRPGRVCAVGRLPRGAKRSPLTPRRPRCYTGQRRRSGGPSWTTPPIVDGATMDFAMPELDFDCLVPLRPVVAQHGVTNRMGWWDAAGLLGGPSKTVHARGFLRATPCAQARDYFAVACARAEGIWNPLGCASRAALLPDARSVPDRRGALRTPASRRERGGD